MDSVMGPNTEDPQSMLAKECTVPDAQADLSPERHHASIRGVR